MSAPPPPPPLPPRVISAPSGLPRTSSQSLQQELESRIPKTEEIYEDSQITLYSSEQSHKQDGYICKICLKTVSNQISHSNTHATQILNWLYLGSMNNSQDLNELQNCGINSIINCTSECSNNFLTVYRYYNFPLADSMDNTLSIKEASYLLENLKLDGYIVLVHCVQGTCRAASVVIYYLMKYHGMSLREAFFYARNRRTIVKPRRAFVEQLSVLEFELYGISTLAVEDLWESEYD
jgi:protein-tyrosine phosphatase